MDPMGAGYMSTSRTHLVIPYGAATAKSRPPSTPGSTLPPLREGRSGRSPTSQPGRQVTPLCTEGWLVSPPKMQGASAGPQLPFPPRVPKEIVRDALWGPVPPENRLLLSGTRLSVSWLIPRTPERCELTGARARPQVAARWRRPQLPGCGQQRLTPRRFASQSQQLVGSMCQALLRGARSEAPGNWERDG